MGSPIIKWASLLAFASLVSAAYICFASTFREMGGVVIFRPSFFVKLILHPLFILGLALSFSSTFFRFVLFQQVGISRTVLVSELSVVVMLGMSLLVFREKYGLREIIGSLLILIGILFVGR
jgi:drug/metabolite transporter (DMT)-like permease